MDTYRRVYPQPPIDLSPRADRQQSRALASAEAPVTAAANRCHTCDRPIATAAMWAEPHNTCLPGCACHGICWGDCRQAAVDWRARCLAAERVIGKADAIVEAVRRYDTPQESRGDICDAIEAYLAARGKP